MTLFWPFFVASCPSFLHDLFLAKVLLGRLYKGFCGHAVILHEFLHGQKDGHFLWPFVFYMGYPGHFGFLHENTKCPKKWSKSITQNFRNPQASVLGKRDIL